jgi:short-subunit dehydrogenase
MPFSKNASQRLPRRNLKIDLLINYAGPSLTGDFLSHDVAKELASIQINVQALAGLCPIVL